MKRNMLIYALIINFASTHAMEISKKSSSACCGLDSVYYSIASHIGRNDYLYLAYAGSNWFLKKKIMLKEDIEDLDRYYARYGRSINKTDITVYHTPLHEAIMQGNVETVKLLCSSGADKYKRIKTNPDIGSTDLAKESLFERICWSRYSIDKEQEKAEIKKFLSGGYIGTSAIDLAEDLRDSSNEYSRITPEQRKAIYEFLKD